MKRITSVVVIAVIVLALGACGGKVTTEVESSAGATQDASIPMCLPGVQQACNCAGDGVGVQRCRQDGSGYDACMGCPSSSGGSAGAAGGSQACVPGEQMVCACDDGGQGVQVCRPDGTGYDGCLGCPSSGAGGSGTGGSISTGGSGGGESNGGAAGSGGVTGTGGAAGAGGSMFPSTCLLWYRMNADQNGNPVDSSIYGHHGTTMNGAHRVAGGGPGGLPSVDAWSFDGVDDYVEVPYFDMTTASEVTVTEWFLVSVQPSPPHQESMAYHGGGGEFAMLYDMGGSDHTITFDANTDTWHAATAPFPAGHEKTWAHLVGTWRRNQGVELYLDGELVASNTAPDVALTPLPPSWSSRIGMYGGGTDEAFHGIIADVRIYSRALSDSEAKAVYQGQAVGCGE